ncbi:Unknown protein [Striga hermonthica]|uniref:Uncharacterized protein n=1 Tax=Striga hermonthica TaxID=68872 RepID=A0A9N7MSK7_STRHE|nr:Unknown protein [Striga hermonthica]
MAKSSPTVAALFCLFALSLADHAPPVEDAVSSRAAVHKVPVNHGKQLSTIDVPTVPLNKLTYRAINRRFPVRLSRSCIHIHKLHRKTKENNRISFADEAIFTSGENSDFEVPVVYGGGQSISGRWMGLHGHGSRNGEDLNRIKQIVSEREREIKVSKKLKKRLSLDQNGEEEVNVKMNGGFMRLVRKFLDQYF